jgi:rod shape-determining protein MreC
VKEKRNLVLFVGLVFFHLVLISLQAPKGKEPTYFERAIFAVFSPVQHGVVSCFQKARDLWNNYFYFRQVQKQNQSLREELFVLRQENRLLKNILQSYQGAEEIRSLLSPLSRSIIVASVIGIDSGQIYKSVVLNKGSRDGLKRDMVILDRRGRLVGRVIEPITLKQARVQLITDEESGVGVSSERNKVIGVLVGGASGKCLMRYVLKTNRDISEGEEIVTSGYDGIYPSGILVGKIISIAEDTTLFKKIVIEPYFDFSELDRVAVLAADLRELE